MSTTIDQRVVEMRFNNKQFETNVQTSMSTIDKLKQSLNLTGAAKGLESIDAAAKKCDMSGLSDAVQTVQAKFSALEVMAVTALANITNAAINAGKKIVTALAIDPIKNGFQEYETQINAIQTILANTESKGTTLENVNAALDELNTYADKTIYNFTEMTRNIGTFTAAGVDLDTSVSAIKGIANLAAVSGSTSQQASTAMYQLSQALAAGTVNLMDWNSVVNAGMGGQVFQDALKETARVHGVAIDDMISSEGSFRETLSKGWLTSDILTETLSKFTGDLSEQQLKTMGYTEEQIASIIKMGTTANDAATKVKTFTQLFDTLKEAAQSGWTKSWETIVGDFGEAKAVLTDMSNYFGNIIGESADARNKILSGGLSSGWKQLLHEGIADSAGYEEAIKNVAKTHGVVFDELIDEEHNFQDVLKMTLKDGRLSSNTLVDSLSELTKKTAGLSDEQLKEKGYTRQQIDELEKLNASVQNGTVSLDAFADKMMKASGRENLIESLWNTLKGIGSIITPIKEAFSEIFDPITGEQLYAFTEAIREFTSKLTLSETASANLKSTFKGLFAILNIVKQAFSAVFKAVMPFAGSFWSDFGGGILSVTAKWGDWLVKLNETIKTTGVFTTIMGGIVKALNVLKTAFEGFIKIIKENIVFPGFEIFHSFLERAHERMAGVGEAAVTMGSDVSEAVSTMGSELENSDFLNMLASLWNGVKTVGLGIVEILGEMGSGIAKVIGDINFDSVFDIISGLSLGGIAIAIIKFLKSVRAPLESFTDILDGVRGCFEAYQTQLKAGALLKIASAIAILTASILVIALIDSEKLAASLGAIAVLFADLMVSMSIFGKISANLTGVFKTCTAMINISIAVFILASALKKVGDLNLKQMVTGLVGIVGLTAIMVAAAKVLGSGSATIIKGATQMVIFAAAIKVLASACEDLSSLTWEELAKGLVGIGVLMGEISLFLNTAKFSGKSITTATGIVILAAAMKILASACADFGQMKWEDIGKGLSSIGVLLAEITVFTNLTGNAKHVISTGIALIAIGAAMKIFASSIKDFSTIQWKELALGLVGMAGALLAVTVAVNFMPKNMVGIGVGLIAVSTSLIIMTNALGKLGGMSWGEIAKGLVAIAGAFTLIGGAGLILTPLVPTILALGGAFALIGVGVLGIGAGLLVAGAGLSAIALGFAALATAGAAGATAIVASLTVIISGIASLIPAVIEKIGEGLIVFCRVITDGSFAIYEAVIAVLTAVINAIVTITPKVVDALLYLLTMLLSKLADNIPKITKAGFDILIGLLEGIRDNLGKVITVAVEIVTTFIDAVSDKLPDISDSAFDLIVAFIDTLGETIKKQTPKLVASIIDLAGNIIQGLVDGLLAGVSKVISNVKSIGSSIINAFKDVLGIQSPSKEFMYLGEYIGAGLAIGIDNSIGPAVKSTNNMTEKILKISKKSINEFEDWLNDKKYYNDISLTQELQAWEAVQKRYKQGSEERKKADKEVFRLQNELVASTYQYSMDWIEKEKYYKRLSLFGELSAYNRVQKRYKQGSEERKKADKEVFRLQNEINEAQLRYYSDIDSVQTDSVNKRIELEEQYADKVKSINDKLANDIQALNDKYENEVKSRTTTLYNSYGLFDKAKGQKNVSGDALIENLQSQVDQFSTWSKTLKDLSDRGMDSNLIEELRQMGPAALGEIKALSSMSDEQLSQYTGLWREKHAQAKDQAINELQGLRIETSNEIAKLRQQAEIDLTEYRTIWLRQMEELTYSTTKKLMTIEEEFKKLGLSGVEGLVTNINANTYKVGTSMDNVTNTALSSINNKKPEFTKSGQLIMMNIVAGVQSKNNSVSSILIQIVSRALTDIKNQYNDFFNAGKYLVEGFAEGISVNTYLAEAKSRAMAKAAARAAERELDENSPSKVGYKIGDFFGLAFVNAIGDYNERAYKAGAGMASSARTGLSKAVSNITDIINSGINTQPTIKPVLDLSDITYGTSKLNALFSRSQSISISSGMAQTTTAEIQNGGSLSGHGNSYQFTQNNYSPKALSRLEIYRQTKNQFSAMKGLVEV